MSLNLSVNLAPGGPTGFVLANPVMTASGTFGYGLEYADFLEIQRLGAIVCKGTTLKPREGNPQPRLAETPSGMLNAIGLQNIGVKAVIEEKAPVWAGWQVPVIVNIAGETIKEYASIARQLDGVAGVAGLEINISCPNVDAGGAEFGISAESAAAVTSAVKHSTSLPVLVKLTPIAADIVAIARAVVQAGADAITLINTLKGMAIDVRRRQPVLGNIYGGLSGPAIKPVALQMVYQVAGVVDVPIIGCGGVSTARDAVEFIMAGATAVQVGTAGFANPRAAMDVLEGLKVYLAKEGIKDISEIVGVARRK
jgi:dihydroorotate dehydrogenase (NAD+) catalytic subunit